MWHGVTDDTLARGYALLGDARGRSPAPRRRARHLRTDRRGLVARPAARAALGAGGRSRPTSASCTCTSSPAACGWSAARARRSCCRGCAASRTCTGCSASRTGRARPPSLVGGEVVEQPGLEVLDEESRRAYPAPAWSELDVPTTPLRERTRRSPTTSPPRPGSAAAAAPPVPRRTRAGRRPQGHRRRTGPDRRDRPVARPPPARPGPHRPRLPLRVRPGPPGPVAPSGRRVDQQHDAVRERPALPQLEPLSSPSGNSRRPRPCTAGKMKSRYSSTSPASISAGHSVRLPVTTMSPPSSP